MIDAFKPVRDLESAICEYTGAPYCVTTNSCTMAIQLACEWQRHMAHSLPYETRSSEYVEIPSRTYVGVPMAIRRAGFRGVRFREEDWHGYYDIRPLHVWDSARYFTMGMFEHMHLGLTKQICVSFHHSKVLGDTQGGAVLHNDPNADEWLRRARFDGRKEGIAPKDDHFTMIGLHCYLSPDVAARLLWKLSKLPRVNKALPNDDYPDLSAMEIFR